MSKPYAPQPGTIPFRVIQYLQRLAPGASIASGPLADELDINANSITACMQPALHHGVVKRERVDGIVHWKLGDGTPLPPAPDADEDPDMRSKIVITPAAAASDDKLAQRLERAIKREAEPIELGIQIPLDLPDPEPVFRAFSDGSLSIEQGGTFLRLGEKQAQALQDFMGRAWKPA